MPKEDQRIIVSFRPRCVLGCNTRDVSIHRFPNPITKPERFSQWLNILRNSMEPTNPLIARIVNQKPEAIHKTWRLCDYHFRKEDITIGHNKYHRLLWNAVPMLHLNGLSAKDHFLLDLEMEHNYSTSLTQHEDQTDQTSTRCHQTDQIHEEQNEMLRTHSNVDSETNVNEPLGLDHCIDISMYSDDEDTIGNCEAKTDNVEQKEDFNNKKVLHEGFLCNVCGSTIVGYRYTCVQCLNYDLCGSCEARGAHCLHYVLRIPSPRPYAEIKSLLDSVRAGLDLGSRFIPVPDIIEEDDIKCEPQELEQDPIAITEDNRRENNNNNTSDNIIEKCASACLPESSENPEDPRNDEIVATEFVSANGRYHQEASPRRDRHKPKIISTSSYKRLFKNLKIKPNTVRVISNEETVATKNETDRVIHVITIDKFLRKKKLKKHAQVNVTRLSKEELKAALSEYRTDGALNKR